MPVLPSRLDLQAVGRTYFHSRARRIDQRAVDVEGSDANLFVGSAAAIGNFLIGQLAAQFGAHLLETAEGEDLDRWVRSNVWVGPRPMLRKGAAPAVVEVMWTRPTAAGGAGSVPVGTRVAASGAEYVTTTQATFASGDLLAVCDARAVQAGREFQVGANAIDRAVQPSLLFDASLRPTNSKPAAGGEPRESDDVFRERARRALGSAARGTLGAIEAGLTSTPGVESAVAFEAYGPIFYELSGFTLLGVSTPVPARVVLAHVADGTGVANAALARAASLGLREWRAAGIQVVVVPGLPRIVPVKLRLAFSAGVNTAALSELVRAAVVEYVNSLAVGVTLERGALFALLRRYRQSGLVTGEDSIAEPVGDVIPNPGETLRTTLANVMLI